MCSMQQIPMQPPVERLFTNASLDRLIWPLVVEQLLSITLGMADVIMVATLGEAAVSGVSLVDNINILINNIFAALATGGAVVCAQYIGRRDEKMVSLTARQLMYAVTAAAAVLMCAGLVFRYPLLSFVFGDIDTEVMDSAQRYFFVTLFSLPGIALYNGCAALFRAQGNSKVSMFIALLVNILNIGGNALLVFGLGWHVEGVAVPTLAARTAAALVLLALLYRDKPYRGAPAIDIHGLCKFEFDLKIIRHILAIGIPNGLENSMFQIGKIVVLTLIASFGTTAIAANAAANTVASLETLPGAAIGLAMLTVVGQCLGAGRPEEAAYFARRLLVITYVSMIALNAPLLVFSEQIAAVFHLQPDTMQLARRMFCMHGLFSMLIWPLSFTLPNALRAAGEAKFTMIVSMLSMWTIRVGVSYLFAAYTGFSALGVWYAMILDWAVRSAVFSLRFKQGAWKRRRLV